MSTVLKATQINKYFKKPVLFHVLKDINFSLDPYGTLRGTVVEARTHEPLPSLLRLFNSKGCKHRKYNPR